MKYLVGILRLGGKDILFKGSVLEKILKIMF